MHSTRPIKLFLPENETGGEAMQCFYSSSLKISLCIWLCTCVLILELTLSISSFLNHSHASLSHGWNVSLKDSYQQYCAFFFLFSRMNMVRPLVPLTVKRQTHFAGEFPLVLRPLMVWEHFSFAYRKDITLSSSPPAIYGFRALAAANYHIFLKNLSWHTLLEIH